MDKKSRLRAAAIAAVSAYIRAEEDAVVMASMPREPAPVEPPYTPPKLWAASGRQEQMQLNSLMQLKAFHGVRFR